MKFKVQLKAQVGGEPSGSIRFYQNAQGQLPRSRMPHPQTSRWSEWAKGTGGRGTFPLLRLAGTSVWASRTPGHRTPASDGACIFLKTLYPSRPTPCKIGTQSYLAEWINLELWGEWVIMHSSFTIWEMCVQRKWFCALENIQNPL